MINTIQVPGYLRSNVHSSNTRSLIQHKFKSWRRYVSYIGYPRRVWIAVTYILKFISTYIASLITKIQYSVQVHFIVDLYIHAHHTFTTHLGNISLWSMIDVTACFRVKYMGCPHSLISVNISQSFLYNLYRFSIFLKWGGPHPTKKLGGMLVTQGLQRQWGHPPFPSSSVNWGRGTSSVYPLGAVPKDSIS